MKICITFVLLTILCPGGCPVYDFDLITVEDPNDFSNDLKLAAQLSSEAQQGLLKLHLNKDNEPDEVDVENGQDAQQNEEYVETKLQRETKENAETSAIKDFVGTNLFNGNRKKCFTSEDVALLAARKDFELLIPKDLPQSLLTDDMVAVLMQYFYGGNQVIQRMTDNSAKRLIERAFYDMLGGYLKYYMVPVTKFSYYAGKANLKTTENVIALYQQCKVFLNTNGNGWKAPLANVLNALRYIKIEPLKLIAAEAEEPSWCIQLDLTSINSDAEDDQMIVSLPKLEIEDSDGFLGNIWLPYKRKRTFNLRSPKSAYRVVKFFEAVTRCYRFQSMCQDTYNHKFKAWILENIQVHLSDEQFYPGLGGILRIYENLRRGKKAADNYDVLENDADKEEDTRDEDDRDEDDSEEVEEYNSEASEDEGDDDEGANSSMRKRHKTEEYREIENKSKQMEGKNDNWFEMIYGKSIKSRNDKAKVDCIPKKVIEQTTKCIPKAGGSFGGQGNAISKGTTGSKGDKSESEEDEIKPKEHKSEGENEKKKPKSKEKEKPKSKEKSEHKTEEKMNPKAKEKHKQQHKDKKKSKEKAHEKNKPKEKKIKTTTEKTPEGEKSKSSFMSSLTQQRYLKYILYVIAFILGILLLILCCVTLSKMKFKRKTKQSKPPIEKKPSKPPEKEQRAKEPPKEQPPKKRRTFCDRLRGRTATVADDEVTTIKPDTKSVIGRHSSSSSSSALLCQPRAKCIPCSLKKAPKDAEAPIIETTSMDLSSSEPESKKKKPKKVVTIDEKKKSTSKKKKARRDSSGSESSKSNTDVTKNSSKKSKTGSWETMYGS